ncbi:MAG: hypothetical protein QM757_24130 [Paludibaculum sp.]
MNLSLDFPDPNREGSQDDSLGLTRRADLAMTIARLRAWMEEPNSPIRAIRRRPAKPGQFVPMPGGVPAALRKVLEEKGITQLYTHQAACFEILQDGGNPVVVHSHGQREDALL